MIAVPPSDDCSSLHLGGSLNTIAPLGSEWKALNQSRQTAGLFPAPNPVETVLTPGVRRGLEAGAWTGSSKRLARLCGRAGETGRSSRKGRGRPSKVGSRPCLYGLLRASWGLVPAASGAPAWARVVGAAEPPTILP
jgi:hypothetical protein